MVAGTRRGFSHVTVVSKLVASRPARVLSPRFSIPVEYHPCSVLRPRTGETVPRESCGADAGRLDGFEALADAGESSDPDSLQASALLAIVGDDDTEQAASAAITRLSRALRLSRRRVPLLVDLSAAHLVRAQRTQNPRDLLEGLNYALEAVATEPHNPAARFNTALALQTLGLDEQAKIAWTDYLRSDSTSRWAEEARERRSLLRHPPMTEEPPQPGAPEAEVRAFAGANPQEARLYGWDSVLGDWGSAHEAGNPARTAELLQLAEQLGGALEARGGDASLADAVRAIRAVRDDPAATRLLARAHRAYAAGQVLNESGEHAAARDSFARAARAAPFSPVLTRSAEVFGAATLIFDGQFAEADSRLQAVLLRIDSLRNPALVARALWIRGSGLLRNGHPAEARAAYQAAARLFERAGETEYTAAQWQMEGEAAYAQRDTLAAYRLMHRGLMSLREHRSSVRLHNTLLVLANCATVDQMPRAALVVQDEDVSVALREKRVRHLVEALLGRARTRWARGRQEEASEDLYRADSLVRTIRASRPRKWLTRTVGYSRALVAPDTASVADLDSAVAFFTKDGNSAWLLPALLQRADVRLARRELSSATADLNAATTRIHGLSQSLGDASLRVAVMEQARSRFDQLVMLHLHAGDTIAALQAVERGRVSFAPGYGASALGTGLPAAPPGQVAVEYALIGDTLLTWTLRGTDVRLLRRTVSRGNVLTMIERSVAALESPARAAFARPDLARLYELLVRPVENRLGRAETPLVILVDGEIAGVPFDVLLDARRARYLVQDHPLRFAATLAEAARSAPPADRSAPALLVADPAFDPTQYPTLDRLRGARAEVDSLRMMYRASVVLQGPAATRDALRDRAPGASVIHYAGHAVFDDARPEQSALVLAGSGTTGRLTAEAVNALQLRGVRLVVLAACRTVRSREGRSGGLAGFSGALLAAGAGGVVGRLWEADDRLTQPLMLAFHRAYRRSADPAAALREAQLELLRSNDPARHSPAAWAGFRYIGS
ncbi:CHAT domain-containing protein [Longimicrobium sp.]|uniref:CHAT domain-containing protein n=1 Tax=Longimicrobium sp. TaxID=2029185 RepID=UPI002D7E1F39|nr:CHAT domain-containing protein [Longimicrobium sp.]